MSWIHVLTQAAIATSPAATATQQQAVTSYVPAYFVDQQPNTAIDMLNRIPGFTLDTGASVRGYEGAAGNVLIDGKRPASKSDNLQDILIRVPAGKVERIDIIRGGAPGIDMQGKAVLANLILKKDGGLRALLALGGNRVDDGRTQGQIRTEASGGLGEIKWELSGRIGRGWDDGAGAGKGQRITPGAPTLFTGYDSEGDNHFRSGVGAVEAPLLGGSLRLNGRLFSDVYKSEEFTRIQTSPETTEQSVFIQDTDETEIGGRYNRAFGPQFDLELVGLRQTRDRLRNSLFTDTAASRFTARAETVETIARGVVSWRPRAGLSFEVGAETAVNTLESNARRTRNGVEIRLPAGDVGVEEDRSEVFVKTAWRPSPQWTLDAGLRYETSTISAERDVVLEKTLRYLKPRLAVTWSAREGTQLRLRLEREVDQLNFNDFVSSGALNSAGGVTAGNPDLDPGQSWVAEVAVEQRFWTSGSITLTYRHAELSDVVDRGPVVGPSGVFDQPENIGSGTRDVLSADLTLPFERLGLKGALLKGNLTKRFSKVTDPTTGETRFQSGLHRLDWDATFTYDLPTWNLTWGLEAYGAFRESEYRFNAIREFKLNTYVKPFVEYKPRKDINIRLELPNATRRNLHETFYVFPGLRVAGAQPTFIDDRRTNSTAASTFLRVRKSFG